MRYITWKKRLQRKGIASALTHYRLCQDSEHWASCALGEALGIESAHKLYDYISGCPQEADRQWWWSIPKHAMDRLVYHGGEFHIAIYDHKWKRARKELEVITKTVQWYRRKLRKGVRDMAKAVAVLCTVGVLAAACSLESPIVRSVRSTGDGLLVTSCHRGLPPGKGGNIVTGLTEECGEYLVQVK